MKMTLRTDVVHEIVRGRHVFVALRTAWDECPFILTVSPRTGLLWDSIAKGLSKTECTQAVMDHFSMNENAAEKLLESFIRSAVKFHYLSIEEDHVP